jgi:nicotinic acid mononucleotide adenylyltransferase
MDISSTRIRDLIRQNQAIDFLVPESVREYITAKGLYR